jgi:hypothetical protein
MLPLPKEGEDENRPPTAVEFCATYACKNIISDASKTKRFDVFNPS